MQKTIFVKLLSEGSDTWRPVKAIKLSENLFKIVHSDTFNPEDEEWEFLPGTVVVTEGKTLSGKLLLTAVREYKNKHMIQKKYRNKLFTKNIFFVIFVCIPILSLSVYSFITSHNLFDYTLSGSFILAILFLFGNGFFQKL